ncbi:hypothetical protein [Ascidiimonas sp. W6]|uniref:hypothetical protein n=1 Tax=Ascidiimonas meishanensis TaxID=3128903 RepID=UPI0030EC189E
MNDQDNNNQQDKKPSSKKTYPKSKTRRGGRRPAAPGASKSDPKVSRKNELDETVRTSNVSRSKSSDNVSELDTTIRGGNLTSRIDGREESIARAVQSEPSGGLGRWSSGSGSDSDLSKMVKATRGIRLNSKPAFKETVNQAANTRPKAPERKSSYNAATITVPVAATTTTGVAGLQSLATLPNQDRSSGNRVSGSTAASNKTTKKDTKKKANKSKRKPSGL